MGESIAFAVQVYFLAIFIGCIAGLMKGLILGIQRISAKKEAAAAVKEGEEA